jgi:hypothetical protein
VEDFKLDLNQSLSLANCRETALSETEETFRGRVLNVPVFFRWSVANVAGDDDDDDDDDLGEEDMDSELAS